MLALGIVKSHEPAACIVDDQKGIVAWVAEERFAGLKHPMYLFPERSIRYCLTAAGLKSINEVDKICFTYHPKERAVAATRQYLRNFKPVQLFIDVPFTFYENKTRDIKILKNLFNLDTRNGPKIEFFNHHLCHTASTYYCSGFKKSKIITIDSRGDTNNGLFAIGKDMQNKKYYDLIKHFDKQTGIPVLMNTSLNIQGQPIIENPKQAIAFFHSEGADMMVLGDYILEKK